jgi:hypothetical protein
MDPTNTDLANLGNLKVELQATGKEDAFERLTAALISNLLDLPIFVAATGFQYGGDAGPAGQLGRRFRIECKKYADTTALKERELLGEIDQALSRDKALEAWFLVSTREVPEQLAQTLDAKADEIGVVLQVIDWRDQAFSPLAALCASGPRIVETHFSAAAATYAQTLIPNINGAIGQLTRSLQAWCLGFSGLRGSSHRRLGDIWQDPVIANAEFGQNAAGGAETHKISRDGVHVEFQHWWDTPTVKDSPALVVGYDGVGKTWATLDWLMQSRVDQPIVLVVPSSAMGGFESATETSLSRLLGERLFELTRVRNADHWRQRIGRLVARPAEEGPVFTVFFDGLNQESSVPWDRILKIVQAQPFAGRVRVIASTRTRHFEDRLSALRGLVVPPTRVNVGVYGIESGGELDRMLAFHGLTQADLHSDLVELARTPRLFRLVVHLRKRLANAQQITVHRLLWEYGRDSFGERVGKSFSEADWHDWLREIARQFRKGITEFSVKALSETTHRADLSTNEVYARLSDILDGQFSHQTAGGTISFMPALVAHSLAIALLSDLATAASFEAIENRLNTWLDPISGLDQRAEILRAAVSIQIERGNPGPEDLAGVLVTAWLQTQNIPETHRTELLSLAPSLTAAILDAMERSTSPAQASARHWAMLAIRRLPKIEGVSWATIVDRVTRWLSIVSRELYPHRVKDEVHEKLRRERLIDKVGHDESGPMTVLGVPVEFVDVADDQLAEAAPRLLEGYPLQRAMKCFEAAVVSFAIRSQSDAWQGFKWLCQLNEVDPGETAIALRALSQSLRTRTAEHGVHSTLAPRAAALTLLLSGIESDEEEGVAIPLGLNRKADYERDYLAHPSRSFYALERRHAEVAFADVSVPLISRLQRLGALVFEPTYSPPDSAVAELRAMGAAFPADQLHRQGMRTRPDHLFEELEPALARWAPDVLADLVRRKYRSLSTCPAESRYWAAGRVEDHFILADAASAEACRVLRASSKEPKKSNDDWAVNQLLVIELKGLDTLTQFERVMSADLQWISLHIGAVLGKPTSAEIDQLVGRYASGSATQQKNLVLLLSFHPEAITEPGWHWLITLLGNASGDLRGMLFRFLALANPMKFGQSLIESAWSWNATEHFWTNHFGSFALMKSETGLPFDQLSPRIAPWRVLEAARLRGSDDAEVRLAGEVMGRAIAAQNVPEPDPGSTVSIDCADHSLMPFRIDIKPRRPDSPDNNPAPTLAALDPDARLAEFNRTLKVAATRIDNARHEGASLYLTDVDPIDVAQLILQAEDLIPAWLEGMDSRAADFRRRVRLAEGAYLALCEALLTHRAEQGVALWGALRETLSTRYLGEAKIAELIHMLFRVPDSAAVRELQRKIYSETATDAELFELVIAARYNKNEARLVASVKSDQSSPYVWRQRRMWVEAGFFEAAALPVDAAWPSDVIETPSAQIRHKAGESQSLEACAHHWWRRYLAVDNAAEAYAAWVLFCAVADRRAWVWFHDELDAIAERDAFFREKLAHVEVNKSDLEKAMDERDKKRDDAFLNQAIVGGLGPWAR